MKLHYDDDKTPPDYEPPLFRAAQGAEGEYHFSSDPTKIKLGEVDTRYHR